MHAVFHLTYAVTYNTFVLWAEGLQPSDKDDWALQGKLHPFALPYNKLKQWCRKYLPNTKIRDHQLLMELPGSRQSPQPSPLAGAQGVASAGTGQMQNWAVEGVAFRVIDPLSVLLNFPANQRNDYDSDLVFWLQMARHLLHEIHDERYIPSLENAYYDNNNFVWRWWYDPARLHQWENAMPATAIHQDMRQPAWQQRLVPRLDALLLGCDTLLTGFMQSHTQEITHNLKQNHQYRTYMQKSAWEKWENALPPIPPSYRLAFRLHDPHEDQTEWLLEILLQSEDDTTLYIPAQDVWVEGIAYDHLSSVFDYPRVYLMQQIADAAEHSPIVEKNINDTFPGLFEIQAEDAYAFLVNDALTLEKAGYAVQVPDWWQRQQNLKIRSHLLSMDESLGLLGSETLFSYQWRVAIGDDIELSREEFEELVSLKKPLVQHQGRWVTLDDRQIKAAQAFFEQSRKREGTITLFDALHASSQAESATVSGLLEVEKPQVAAEVEKAFRQLRQHQKLKKVNQPSGLNTTLRPYQLKGFQWLVTMRERGLGACLADDMGLGKTIQTIALWLYERAQQPDRKPALLICPTSVVGNWQHEVHQFAPDLRVLTHHGAARLSGDAFWEAVKNADVVLTSYALLTRDLDDLKAVEWDSVTLDEAQNIKNPTTKQSQAARAFKTPFRLALTGTPIENRLSELWSLFAFLNPGYLGARKPFQQRFATPIEKRNDQQAAKTLRQLVAPFILRRVKTDSSVIQDLPDKFENRVFCNLTTEQATLYEAIVQTELENIAMASSQMERRGAILRMLVHLKQVCNHPAQYLKQKDIHAKASGKLQRLTELVLQVRENNERALIFTQYARMGQLLQDYISDLLGEAVLFLHGGTPGIKRTEMVAEFQADGGPPVFVLSLKAGGTGLNLTAATQVFHFDRWYNPAVEDQATDRAYRIGQRQVVQVHKFISIGTLEERIDALLTRKREIADQVIGSGEGWISEMNDTELRELVTLRTEAVLS